MTTGKHTLIERLGAWKLSMSPDLRPFMCAAARVNRLRTICKGFRSSKGAQLVEDFPQTYAPKTCWITRGYT